MTQITKNKLDNIFSKLSATIIIGLISFIAYQAVDFKDTIINKMDRYEEAQYDRMVEFRDLYDWTHSVNEFVIMPTKKLAEENHKRINELSPRGSDEYNH